jgi:hypothetical protein
LFLAFVPSFSQSQAAIKLFIGLRGRIEKIFVGAHKKSRCQRDFLWKKGFQCQCGMVCGLAWKLAFL